MGITTSIDNTGQIFGPIIGTFLVAIPNGFVYSLTLAALSLVAFSMGLRLPQFHFDEKPTQPKKGFAKHKTELD